MKINGEKKKDILQTKYNFYILLQGNKEKILMHIYMALKGQENTLGLNKQDDE